MRNTYTPSVTKSPWLVLLTGILFTIFGLISLISTWTAIEAAAIYIAIVSIVAGAVTISYAITNYTFLGWAWAMIEGVVDVLFGVLVLTYPVFTAKMLPLIIGIWILFRGLIFVVGALGYSTRYPMRSALSRFSMGLVLLLLGFVLVVGWELKLPVLSIIISTSFVFIGLWNFVAGLDMYARHQILP